MNLGETILRLRTSRGMSQEDLVSTLEVSRQSFSKWETNTSIPDLDKLVKLSTLCDVTLDELVLGEKKEEPLPSGPITPEIPPKRETSIGLDRTPFSDVGADGDIDF